MTCVDRERERERERVEKIRTLSALTTPTNMKRDRSRFSGLVRAAVGSSSPQVTIYVHLQPLPETDGTKEEEKVDDRRRASYFAHIMSFEESFRR